MVDFNVDYKWFQPFYWHNTQGNSVPLNTHLVWNTAYNTLYWVDSVNPKLLKKTTDGGVTVSTIITRTGKDIARAFPDLTDNKIYFVDCEYDNLSYIWYLDLTTDLPTEIESVPANVYDVWRYGNETYIIYFSTTYDLETITMTPNGDLLTNWNTTGGNHFGVIDEDPATPNTADYISENVDSQMDAFSHASIDLSAYDSGVIYEFEIKLYCKGSGSNAIGVASNNPLFASVLVYPTTNWSWKSVIHSGVSYSDGDFDDFLINVYPLFAEGDNVYIATLYTIIRFKGDFSTKLYIKNLNTSTIYTNNMGSSVGRTFEISYTCLKSADDQFYFLWKWSNENAEFWRFDLSTTLFTEMEDCGANTNLATSQNQRGISYDDVDVFYFVLKDTSDNKSYLYSYAAVSDVLTKICEYNIALGLQRNTDNTADLIWNLEKAFDMINDADNKAKIYQISKSKDHLFAIAQIDVGAGVLIQAITDKYIFLSNGKLYKWINAITSLGAKSVIRARQRNYWTMDMWINEHWIPEASHFAWDSP